MLSIYKITKYFCLFLVIFYKRTLAELWEIYLANISQKASISPFFEISCHRRGFSKISR